MLAKKQMTIRTFADRRVLRIEREGEHNDDFPFAELPAGEYDVEEAVDVHGKGWWLVVAGGLRYGWLQESVEAYTSLPQNDTLFIEVLASWKPSSAA